MTFDIEHQMTVAQVQYSPTVLTVKVKFLTSQWTNSACNQGSSVKLHAFSRTCSYSLQNFAHILKSTVLTSTHDT